MTSAVQLVTNCWCCLIDPTNLMTHVILKHKRSQCLLTHDLMLGIIMTENKYDSVCQANGLTQKETSPFILLTGVSQV